MMKNRLNITVDDTLLEQAKRYAAKNQTSLSRIVEEYFRSLVRPARKKNILQLLNKLPKATVKTEGEGRKTYYEGRKTKYGF
jgi:Arc/MetJ family transcription regulator